MFRKIDHIGVAVRSIARSARLYAERIGMPVGAIETVPTEGVRVAFLGEGETHLELLEPTDETGPVARFLARRGEGVHHICFAVDGIDAAIAALQEAGVGVIGEAPRPGAGGCRVAFLDPKTTGGVLIELSERPPEGSGRAAAAPAGGGAIRAGQVVVAYLREPKERFWGLLREMTPWGATVEGLELTGFDDWLAAAAAGEAAGSVSTVLFPLHRLERILLDRPSAGAAPLEERLRQRVGCGLAEFLSRGR